MKRAIAGVYFAALCLHGLLWIRMLVLPNAASSDAMEMLAILVVAGSPLILLAAILGLVEPRKPVARIAGIVLLAMCAETFRAVSTAHATTHMGALEAAIAIVISVLGVIGLIIVTIGKRKRSAPTDDVGVGSTGVR